MIVDCAQYKVSNSKIFTFLSENKFNCLELRLLLFWARHPHAKLSLYTIASALDTARVNLRDAISSLVRRSILVEHSNSNGLTTYALSSTDKTRESLDELAEMDWNQIRILEQQLQGEAVLL